MAEQNSIKIVIAVNKKDVWFCRICVASVRYYYPETDIFLLKDELNGEFSTKELEKYWNVQLIDFGKKRYGWSAAKIFFYTDKRFSGQYFLVLDSDIVFTGKLLDKLKPIIAGHDVVVSSEVEANPYAEWVEKVYFDVRKVEQLNSNYKYPGYFFNAGQLVLKGGVFNRSDFFDFFDFDEFPYWKNLKTFPLVDQSMLNYLLPVFSNEGRIKVHSEYKYMIWSQDVINGSISIEAMKDGTKFPFLIHWAGALRIPYLRKMSRNDILRFFEKKYYEKLPLGNVLRYIRKVLPLSDYYLRRIYYRSKSIYQRLK